MGKEVADKKASTKKIYKKTQPIRYLYCSVLIYV